LAVLPFAVPQVVFCAEDNYRCQTRPRRAGVALLKPAALRPYLSGEAIEDVLITTADPRALVADGTPVIHPRGCTKLDVGVVLGVLVVGGRSPVIRGCFAMLDFVRADVPRNQAYLIRSFPTHKVVSTTMAQPSVLEHELTLTLAIDGKPRQRGTTTSMIANVHSLIEVIARHYRHSSEWLLLTGSPAGRPIDTEAGWVQPGMLVEAEVTDVGTVTARVTAEGP